MTHTLIIATRKSPLALYQAEHIKQLLLTQDPSLQIQLLPVVTSADLHEKPLAHIGGKHLFVTELQQRLLDGRADLAVHSVKDLGTRQDTPTTLIATPQRADARDVILCRQKNGWPDLPHGAIVGTSSPRRCGQLRYHQKHLSLRDIRGNIGTRIAKLNAGEYDAIVLAAAGLDRLALNPPHRHCFPTDILLPAIGQGAIGIECLRNHPQLHTLCKAINHDNTWWAVTAERAVNTELGGSCFSPIAAHATVNQSTLVLTARVTAIDGSCQFTAQASGCKTDAQRIGIEAAKKLIDLGAAPYIQHL